jgi:hypothetical protein
LYEVLKGYVTNSFFVRYEGVAFGVLAILVACAPGMSSARPFTRGARASEREPRLSPVTSRLPSLSPANGLT